MAAHGRQLLPALLSVVPQADRAHPLVSAGTAAALVRMAERCCHANLAELPTLQR